MPLIFWLVQAPRSAGLRRAVRVGLVALWAVSHFLRAIGLTLAFHRYFAHRAFQMNRVGAVRLGVHRHRGDAEGAALVGRPPRQPSQVRRPRRRSAQPDGERVLLRAHRLVPERHQARRDRADQPGHARLLEGARDRAGSTQYYFLPPLLLAMAMYPIGGLPWLVWGFCLPTMTLAHATFAINTVNHMFGSRRFETIDESRNNPLTAFFAVGEGWHNNHHRYQRAARNGFYWWEFDLDLVRHPRDGGGRPGVGRAARAGADLQRGAGRACRIACSRRGRVGQRRGYRLTGRSLAALGNA